MRFPQAALLLAALLALGLQGCGDGSSGTSMLPSGPPLLRRAVGKVRPFGGDATLVLASPARVIVMYRRDGVEDRIFMDATLPGSALVEISYTSLAQARGPQADPLPPAQDKNEARTESHGFDLHVTVGGFLGDLVVKPTVWTREGRALARTWSMVPTLLGEIVPFGQEIDLAAVAVADTVENGHLSLSHANYRMVAHVKPPLGPEDRLHMMRLILRVESVGDPLETP